MKRIIYLTNYFGYPILSVINSYCVIVKNKLFNVQNAYHQTYVWLTFYL